MNTLTICIAGILFLVFFSFLLSFYRDITRAYRIKAARRKRLSLGSGTANENEHRSHLKIPGYYEELSNRSKKEEHYSQSRPTII